jgi:hypothetical protein
MFALMLLALLAYEMLRTVAGVGASAAPGHGGSLYFVVMPHPASDENRRVAKWLSHRLDCPIVQDASVHEVGVRGAK